MKNFFEIILRFFNILDLVGENFTFSEFSQSFLQKGFSGSTLRSRIFWVRFSYILGFCGTCLSGGWFSLGHQ